MSIIYPLTLPAAPGFRKFNLTASSAVGEVISPFTGQAQEQQWQDTHWELQAELPPMLRKTAAAGQWIAFFLALQGKYGTFLVGDPAGTAPLGSALLMPGALTAQVNGTVSAGQQYITTRYWQAQALGVLLRGDYIQIGSGTTQRLYQVMQDVNADPLNDATIFVFPSVREAIADGTPLVLNNTAGCFRLADNRRTFEVDQNRTLLISLKAREAI